MGETVPEPTGPRLRAVYQIPVGDLGKELLLILNFLELEPPLPKALAEFLEAAALKGDLDHRLSLEPIGLEGNRAKGYATVLKAEDPNSRHLIREGENVDAFHVSSSEGSIKFSLTCPSADGSSKGLIFSASSVADEYSIELILCGGCAKRLEKEFRRLIQTHHLNQAEVAFASELVGVPVGLHA